MISKKRVLFIFLILFFSLIPIPSVSAAWLAGWDKRVLLSIDSGDVDGALSNFPILLYLSSSSGINGEDITFIFDEVGANSLKIAVTTSDGQTECYVEVDKWDLGNEKAWLWVKVPSVASGSDTDLYLYFDNSHADNINYVGVANSVPAENVWTEGYVFVSHMRDDPDTSNIRDSTTNDLDGTKLGANQPITTANGIIDDAQDFDGNNDYVSLGDSALFEFGDGAGNDSPFSVEMWSYMHDATQFRPIGKYEGTQQEWIFHLAGDDRVYFYCLDRSASKYIGRYYTVQLTGWISQWLHFAGTYSGNEASTGLKIYINATRRDNANFEDLPYSSMEPGNSPVILGGLVSAGVYGDGLNDEVRVSDVERNIAWLKGTYETGRDHILDWGIEETVPITAPSDPDLLFGAGFNASQPFVELHWNHSTTNVQFFEVQNSSDGISWDYLGQSITANYTDVQVNNGTERYYRVRACNQTGGTWYNSSFTDINFETVHFIRARGPGLGPTVIRNVTGEWVYYNLITIGVTVGVHDSGDLNSTLDIDGDTYDCSEVVGVPGYVIEFEWADVDLDAHCLWVCAYIFYDGVSAHTIDVDLWNFTSTAWVTIGIIYDMVGFEWVNSSIYDLRMPNDFINSTGAVRGRFYHSSAGNINDDIHTDFLKLYAFIPSDVVTPIISEDNFFWVFIAIVLSIITALLVWMKYGDNNN